MTTAGLVTLGALVLLILVALGLHNLFKSVRLEDQEDFDRRVSEAVAKELAERDQRKRNLSEALNKE